MSEAPPGFGRASSSFRSTRTSPICGIPHTQAVNYHMPARTGGSNVPAAEFLESRTIKGKESDALAGRFSNRWSSACDRLTRRAAPPQRRRLNGAGARSCESSMCSRRARCDERTGGDHDGDKAGRLSHVGERGPRQDGVIRLPARDMSAVAGARSDRSH